MSISQLARSIVESPTLKLNETAAILREKGEPVIHLGGGEPKSKAPMDAILSCTALLNTGDIKYSPADGIPALKKAGITGVFCGGTEMTPQFHRFAVEELLEGAYFAPTYGNTLMGLAASAPLRPDQELRNGGLGTARPTSGNCMIPAQRCT